MTTIMENQEANREKKRASRQNKGSLKKQKEVLVRANVARMDTDSDSDSDDQYSLKKVGMGTGAIVTERETTTKEVRSKPSNQDLDEIDQLL